MKSGRLWVYSVIVRCLPESRFFGLKSLLLRWAGASVGKNVSIYSSVSVMGIGKLEIEDDVFIGSRTIISSSGNATVHIGKQVAIGPLCYISTGAHLIDPVNLRTCGEGFNRNIRIEDGAWLAVHTVLTPSVLTKELRVGSKAITMPGTVVSSEVPPRTIVAAAPCVIKGEF